MRRTACTLAAALGVVALTANAGYAVWTFVTDPTSVTANVQSLGSPVISGPTTGAQASKSINVAWSASSTTGGAAATSYAVTRQSVINGVSTSSPAGGTCASATATSCVDTVSADGLYSYRVTAVYKSWTRASTADSGTVTVDTTGPAVTISSPLDGATISATSTSFSGLRGTDGGDSAVTVTVANAGGTVATPAVTNTPSGWTTASVPLSPGNYTVTARQSDSLGNESAPTRTFTMANPASAAGLSITTAASPVAGTAFSVTVQALLSDGTNDTTYSGPASGKTLVATGEASPSGVVPVVNSIGPWSNGQASVSVTVSKAGSYTLTLTDSGVASRTGAGNFTVTAAAPAKLGWAGVTTTGADTLPTPCLWTCDWGTGFGNNQSVTAAVAVTDSYGNTVSGIGAGRTVTVTRSGGQSGSFTNPATAATSIVLDIAASGHAVTAAFTWTSDQNANFSSTLTASPTTWTTPPATPSNATMQMRR